MTIRHLLGIPSIKGQGDKKYDVGFCVRLEEIGWPIGSIRDDRNSSSWINSGPIGSNLEDPSASSRSSILITEFSPIR